MFWATPQEGDWAGVLHVRGATAEHALHDLKVLLEILAERPS